MNNKKTGSDFERETCKKLNEMGYWVHFITPDSATGKQPFDIIAVKNDEAFAIDCKTCEDRYFRISRAEENQILAFNKWLKCGNSNAMFLVKHDGWACIVSHETLMEKKKVDLESYEVGRLFKCDL